MSKFICEACEANDDDMTQFDQALKLFNSVSTAATVIQNFIVQSINSGDMVSRAPHGECVSSTNTLCELLGRKNIKAQRVVMLFEGTPHCVVTAELDGVEYLLDPSIDQFNTSQSHTVFKPRMRKLSECVEYTKHYNPDQVNYMLFGHIENERDNTKCYHETVGLSELQIVAYLRNYLTQLFSRRHAHNRQERKRLEKAYGKLTTRFVQSVPNSPIRFKQAA